MTFHGSEETAVKAFRLGARDYVIKPFGADEMYQAMDRALSETVSARRRTSWARSCSAATSS